MYNTDPIKYKSRKTQQDNTTEAGWESLAPTHEEHTPAADDLSPTENTARHHILSIAVAGSRGSEESDLHTSASEKHLLARAGQAPVGGGPMVVTLGLAETGDDGELSGEARALLRTAEERRSSFEELDP
jgi:spore germination cell wall hydrolase CwlJ-like protein